MNIVYPDVDAEELNRNMETDLNRIGERHKYLGHYLFLLSLKLINSIKTLQHNICRKMVKIGQPVCM